MARKRRTERAHDIPDRWIVDQVAGPALDAVHRATGATRGTIAASLIAGAAILGLGIAWAWMRNRLGENVVAWPAFMPILMALQALQLAVGFAQATTDRQQAALNEVRRDLRMPIERNPERRDLLVQRMMHLAAMLAVPSAVALFQLPPEILVQAATSMGLCFASYILSCDRAPRRKPATPRWGDPSLENASIDRLDRAYRDPAGPISRM